MRKAANGSGTTPFKRPDGRWEAKYITGIDPITGKPIRKSVYAKTQAECAEKARALTASIDKGTYIAPNAMKLSKWLDEWIEDYHGAVKYSTRAANESICRVHIKPALGDYRLDRIQPHDVQRFINSLSRKGVSNKTIKNIHGTLSKALAVAKHNGYIASNPATGTQLPRIFKQEIRPLNEDEIARFGDIVKGHMYADLLTVLLKTGMRLGEGLGLRWSDVDFKKGTITVSGQLTIKRDKDHPRCIDTPKNGKKRTFYAMPDVFTILKRVQVEQKAKRLKAGALWHTNTATITGKTVTDLVFTNDIGENLTHSSVDACFVRMMERNGICGHRLHDLRHTFATQAIKHGVDIETLSKKMLGHSSVAITLDRYGHTTDLMQQEAIAKLQAGWNS